MPGHRLYSSLDQVGANSYTPCLDRENFFRRPQQTDLRDRRCSRSVDHRTTRAKTRGGRRAIVQADPHVTAYMSRSREYYELEGHLYVHYSSSGSGLPSRLADAGERRNPAGGPKMELWDVNTGRPVYFD